MGPSSSSSTPRRARVRPRLRRVAAIAVAGLLLLSACGGSETSGADPEGATLADPTAFAEGVADPTTVVLNVHTPDEGSIAGTDAEIPFDELRARAAELPEDRSTPLAVYCRSGRMSAEAVKTLASLGYTDVTELAGGMQAWEADGRPLLPPGGAALTRSSPLPSPARP